MRRTTTLWTTILLSLILCTTAAVAAPPLATAEVGPAQVTWLVASDKAMTLRIVGEGMIFERTFEAGNAPTFSIFNQNGFAVSDGSYNWEMGENLKPLSDHKASGDRNALQTALRGRTASGHFRIAGGAFVGAMIEAPDGKALEGGDGDKDQVILDDLIVDGSACIGMDCVNGESFGFDTIRMKENNLRLRAVDTSSTSSFPSRDWQLTFNDSSNGGANKFSVDDIDGGRTPFTIEAGAPSHSLYVDDGGRIGLGTSTPVADIHVKSGNTPTLRLEQDGTSGFTPQTWDLAGNEANLFIRDATNGSTLPFRIFPGAPSNALNIEASGEIGIGTTSPDDELHVLNSSADAIVRIEGAGGFTGFAINNTNTATSADEWTVAHGNGGQLGFSSTATTNAFRIATNGDVTAIGEVYSNSCVAPCAPDYVFEDDYPLMPMAELAEFIDREGHLPNVPSAEELVGPISLNKLQMKLLEKLEELTLYTLQQQETIEALKAEMEALKAE